MNRSPSVKTTGLLFIMILSALMAFTSLSTDIYLPAMPIMANELRGDAELTITGFLIGFCLAQLIWGPISDRFGRRPPLIIGMVLFIIGSAGCALSTDITHIVFWRVFQALGACTGPMLARAMIRDLFSRTRAAQMLSTLTIVMAIAPIVGPLLGGQMIKFTSWHAIFWLLTAIGVFMLLSLYWLPETLPPERRVSSSIGGAFQTYYRLLSNVNFMKFTLCLTFYYVAVYAFIAGSPFVYITYFHVDPQHYGWLFAVNIVGVMGLSAVNRRLVQRHPLETLLKGAVLIAATASLVLAVATKLHVGGIALIGLAIFILFSMNGIIAATATAAALDAAPNAAGSASALIGSLQYGSGIISSLLLAMFSDGTPWTMGWIITLFTLASAAMALTTRVSKVGH
ncbi:Bcr/CflA family efflux MFS transporter [Salmonella enterica]|uniref:Bcr/CflA family efflux transporter n=2 Tax=Salmonella enterica TaxID=28901 RepID=A0A702KT99_SALET|nr:Bcr/CflA family efflux MFS transporter [Salmonella enterica subsp. enterica serovar Javiana]EAN0513857.1 Bcr/CflA family efflux MFS transporter [Salmonella enterica]ECE5829098.1 Bcr/CflA family drug resistance efflux transporter [Salmonella enterica subsp. enterica]ECU5729308.1 Bcr/CflA family efflux MFS transporter [Salmonella enterica subsp. enterica serovar 9,12:-:1,5]EHF3057599.1 multidrug effflux MFS transporter [Salmonella enterica subsp. enterica serovar 9,12-:1,5]